MRLIKLAQNGYATGLAGLGLLSLGSGDFALNWQPVPAGVPLRTYLAYLSGFILLVGGIGLLARRTATWGAWILTLFVFSWLLLLQLPRLIGSPLNAGVWLGFCENVLLVTGGWVLCTQLDERPASNRSFIAGDGGMRTARIMFAIALPIIGLSHFVYADATASMVPAWLPDRRALAYLTGAGHMAAGLGILLGIVPRLAALMEAAMITSFVLLLHLPGVATAPSSRLQWTMLCVASTLASAAWAIAATFTAPRRS